MRRSLTALTAAFLVATLLPLNAPAAIDACDWPMYGHDPGRSFAQTCTDITPANVSTLRPKWFVPTDAPVTASPAIVGGVLYVGDWNGVFHARGAETGDGIWSFQVDDRHNLPFGRIVSSAAVDTVSVDGAGSVPVVLFGGGATLYALDPATGALLAKQDTDPRVDPPAPEDDTAEVEIESSPVVGHFPGRDDRIFVGMDVHSGKNVGATGLLSFAMKKNAAGASTPYRFELLYKFDPESSTVRHSLTDGSGTGFGCGGVWSSPMLDEDALGGDGVIVFGTSNCTFPTETAVREGVFAIRAKTGELLWKHQPRAANIYDDDFGASPNLLPGGRVGAAGKDGRYYAFSLLGNGTPAWTSHPAQSGHLTTQFAFGGIIGTPAIGEVASPDGARETAVFIASALSTPIGEPLDSGGFPLDASLADDPGRMFSLHAISAIDGRVLWRSPLSRQAFGAPTYANGVVFVPSTFDASVKAFHAGTGAPLWMHLLNGAPSSSPTIVGDSVYLGTGVTVEPLPLERLSGLWAFELAQSTTSLGRGVLMSAQGNQLDLYDLAAPVPATTRTTPIAKHDHATETGHDINGQACRFAQADGSVRYLVGEDSDQDINPIGAAQGWGIFRADRGAAGAWTMLDKIVAPYNLGPGPEPSHQPENTGCAVSADGSRLFLVDLGIGAFDVEGVGSLFLYLRDAAGNFSSTSPVCVLADDLTTSGYIAEHPDGSVLVPEGGRSSGGVVSRFAPPFPARGDTDACTTYRDTHRVDDRPNFLQGPLPVDPLSFVPISIARRNGKWLVGNVVPGQVNEYDDDGRFVRPITAGQGPGVAGIAVDEDGNAYIANLGLVPCESILCPQEGLGTLWKVSFAPATDAPLPAVLIMAGLTYPEGLAAFPSL